MDTTILIVDDSADWRKLLTSLIGNAYPDAEILSASSLDEAQEQLSQRRFELAILDIRLDESDEDNEEGLDVMDIIHDQYPATSVLMITGYAKLETVKRAMKPGDNSNRQAFDFVEKSKMNVEFLPHIEQILKTRRTQV